MNIVLFGKDGQIGRELQDFLGSIGTVIACGRSDIDLENARGLKEMLYQIKPDIIVNAAAYTRVDQAESDSDKAYAVNATAVETLANSAKEINALLVHYSTDYVFDGTKSGAYDESDAPNPISTYGKSKLAGEEAIKQSRCRYLLLRTSWVYSAHGNNFVKTMLRLLCERQELRIVADQFGVPTSAAFIAQMTVKLLDKGAEGLYHVVPAGKVSWYEYAQYILQHLTAIIELTPITSEQYVGLAKRPKNSVLDNSKMCAVLNSVPPDWTDDVSKLMKQLLEA